MLFAIHQNINFFKRTTSRFHPEEDDENECDDVESGVDEVRFVPDCFERVGEGEGDHEANTHSCESVMAWLDSFGI